MFPTIVISSLRLLFTLRKLHRHRMALAVCGSKQRPHQADLFRLGVDLLMFVGTFLPFRDINSLRCTCTRLRCVCDGDPLWAAICQLQYISPADSVKWRTLAQRLSIGRWGGASGGAGIAGSALKTTTPTFIGSSDGERARIDRLNTCNEDAMDAPPAVLRPKGQWVPLVVSGAHYCCYGAEFRQMMLQVSGVAPLSNVEANSTSSIGIIPVDLEEGSQRSRKPPATVLQQKILALLGVQYRGDVRNVSKVFETDAQFSVGKASLVSTQQDNDAEERRRYGGAGGFGRAAGDASPSDRRDGDDEDTQAINATGNNMNGSTSSSEGPTLDDRSAVLQRDVPLSASSQSDEVVLPPGAPKICAFDVTPHMGMSRTLILTLSPGAGVNEEPNATAQLFRMLLNTCSTVVFAASSYASLQRWLEAVSSHLPMATAAPFSTNRNTPNVVFSVAESGVGVETNANPLGTSGSEYSTNGSSSVPTVADDDDSRLSRALRSVLVSHSCREVLSHFVNHTSDLSEASLWSGSDCSQRRKTEAHKPSVGGDSRECDSETDDGDFVLSRASSVTHFSSEGIPTKPLYLPAWVVPTADCRTPIPIPCILEMLAQAAKSGGNADAMWTLEVTELMCEGQAAHCLHFFEEAMRSEIADAACNLSIAFVDKPVPLDPSEVVALQGNFYYASLRAYAMAVRDVSGSDTDKGVLLMEMFKSRVGAVFRKLWIENITASYVYCHELYTSLFDFSIHQKYGSKAPVDGFNNAKTLSTWVNLVIYKLSEYLVKCKGPRKMDVLVERIAMDTIGSVKQFCQEHPDHPYISYAEVSKIGDDILKYCMDQQHAMRMAEGEALSSNQRTSAVYTACVSNAWGIEAVRTTILQLVSQREVLDQWVMQLGVKKERLGIRRLMARTNPDDGTQKISLVSSPAIKPQGGGFFANLFNKNNENNPNKSASVCVEFSALEVDREGRLRALVMKEDNLKRRTPHLSKQFKSAVAGGGGGVAGVLSMVGSQFSSQSGPAFGTVEHANDVIQSHFSKDYRVWKSARAAFMSNAAEEIATKWKTTAEKVREGIRKNGTAL